MNLAPPAAAAAAPAAPPLTPKAPTIPAPGGIAVPKAGGAPAGGAPAGGAPAGGAAPSKADVAAKLKAMVEMPVADAVAAAGKQLAALQTLTIGGGTKEGVAAAAAAANLLKDTSMLVQVVHRNAVPTHISPELELNLMSVATGMAAASTQIGLMGSASKQPIALKELLAAPTKQAIETLAVVADHVGREQKQAANPSPAGYL